MFRIPVIFTAGAFAALASVLPSPCSGAAAQAAARQPKGDAYPLDYCVVSGDKLGEMGAPVVLDYQGREIRFCCSGCPPKFEADPAQYLKKIDEAIIKQQEPFYPLDTCVVTGEKLGSMGKPIDYVYKNRLIRFCCPACIEKLNADPAKYLAKLDAAVIAKQKPGYPLGTCVVTGKNLGSTGEPIDYVFANRLVRFCSKACVDEFLKDPPKYLAKIDEALKTKGPGAQGAKTQ